MNKPVIREDSYIQQIKMHMLDVNRLGHFPLKDEPLTVEDWEEVWRAYVAFQHQLRLIVLKVRKRTLKEAENNGKQ